MCATLPANFKNMYHLWGQSVVLAFEVGGGGGWGGAGGTALGEGVCFRAPEGYRELWLSVFFTGSS